MDQIVAGVKGQVSRRLMRAMVREFERNGGKMLSAGKVRYLRRVIRRGR